MCWGHQLWNNARVPCSCALVLKPLIWLDPAHTEVRRLMGIIGLGLNTTERATAGHRCGTYQQTHTLRESKPSGVHYWLASRTKTYL